MDDWEEDCEIGKCEICCDEDVIIWREYVYFTGKYLIK